MRTIRKIGRQAFRRHEDRFDRAELEEDASEKISFSKNEFIKLVLFYVFVNVIDAFV